MIDPNMNLTNGYFNMIGYNEIRMILNKAIYIEKL